MSNNFSSNKNNKRHKSPQAKSQTNQNKQKDQADCCAKYVDTENVGVNIDIKA